MGMSQENFPRRDLKTPFFKAKKTELYQYTDMENRAMMIVDIIFLSGQKEYVGLNNQFRSFEKLQNTV
ncbi:hypothetical protein CULT_1470014 [[Clostridium] ultunense Esp]|nr:hypothetical protein CULT_1470014 [[Clostridium] ultunense Esp]